MLRTLRTCSLRTIVYCCRQKCCSNVQLRHAFKGLCLCMLFTMLTCCYTMSCFRSLRNRVVYVQTNMLPMYDRTVTQRHFHHHTFTVYYCRVVVAVKLLVTPYSSSFSHMPYRHCETFDVNCNTHTVRCILLLDDFLPHKLTL